MHEPLDVPTWALGPFVGLLAAIALLPVLAEDFWHKHPRKALVVVLFAIPVAVYLLAMDWTTGRPGTAALLGGLREYLSFIVLLASLYIVSGGILIEGDVAGTPLNNTLILAVGAVLANLIGTTGSSMVLIRFFLRVNQRRRHLGHLVVFFIFTVSNLGGLLTPLGDPPLFIGFLRGVDFFWTLQLWPKWLVANGLVLAVFYAWDTLAFGRDARPSDVPTGGAARLRLRGRSNLVFLAGILCAVLLQSKVVSEPGSQLLRPFVPAADLSLAFPWGETVMILMAVLSLSCTPAGIRPANGFRWEPILEVVILFAGIFVTMVPALDILARLGRDMNLSEPWQYFWLTGVLSAFLDNAPTYLMFATIAAGEQPVSHLMVQAPHILQAISCGAVFLGALTYIGNGPNFMVKAIAEESGYHTPSFFAYVFYSASILLPVFVLLTLLFFLR
jgi:Na+/H+ antiporter NhaD/arsenite permease-like protein